MRGAFGYFDHAYLINLDADRSRLDRVRHRLDAIGIDAERVSAVLPPPGLLVRRSSIMPGHFGCALLYLRVLELARAGGHDRCLILEDDVVFRDDAEPLLGRALPAARQAPWDVLYLGLHLVERDDGPGPYVGTVREGYHTHAYAVSRAGIDKVAASVAESLRRLDGVFDKLDHVPMVKRYVDPILCVQEPNVSATTGGFANQFGHYFGRFFDFETFRANCAEARGNGAWSPAAPGATRPRAPQASIRRLRRVRA